MHYDEVHEERDEGTPPFACLLTGSGEIKAEQMSEARDVGQWIQVAIMHGIQDKVVTAPPPIISRCFQEIANGNVRFQDALKVKSIPFPPAYQLVCDLLHLMHHIATPFLTSLWVNSPALSAMLAFTRCSCLVSRFRSATPRELLLHAALHPGGWLHAD